MAIDDTDYEEGDRCTRAAQAAIEVIQEECGPTDMEVRRIDGQTFMEIPEEDAAEIDRMTDNTDQVSLQEFEQMIAASEWMRSWIRSMISAEIPEDPSNREFAAAAHTHAQQVVEVPLSFQPGDLVGSQALRDIASA